MPYRMSHTHTPTSPISLILAWMGTIFANLTSSMEANTALANINHIAGTLAGIGATVLSIIKIAEYYKKQRDLKNDKNIQP